MDKSGTLKGVLDNNDKEDYPRGYPSMSNAGEPCLRKKQYELYFVKKGKLTARTRRIFAMGFAFEEIFEKEMAEHGFVITGEQDDLAIQVGEHILHGHMDGRIIGIPESPKTEHVMELKALNQNSWKDCVKKGVMLSKPIYYTQVQMYMHATGLRRAIFIAVNKNDSQYYMERVKYDGGFVKDILNKNQEVLESIFLLDRMAGRDFYACKWCDYHGICHDNEPVAINCRTCKHSQLIGNKDWGCRKHGLRMNREYQINNDCTDHELREMFL